MFGTPARGGRLEGADDSTELWRHPTAPLTNDPSLFSIRNDDGDNGNEYDFEFFSTSFWQQKSISLNFFVALICPPLSLYLCVCLSLSENFVPTFPCQGTFLFYLCSIFFINLLTFIHSLSLFCWPYFVVFKSVSLLHSSPTTHRSATR